MAERHQVLGDQPPASDVVEDDGVGAAAVDLASMNTTGPLDCCRSRARAPSSWRVAAMISPSTRFESSVSTYFSSRSRCSFELPRIVV